MTDAEERRWWTGLIALIEQRIDLLFRADRSTDPVYDPTKGGGWPRVLEVPQGQPLGCAALWIVRDDSPDDAVTPEEEYRAAFVEHKRLKAAVVKWMANEAKALRLRQNSDAPMWSDYNEAARRMNIAEQTLLARVRQ